MKEAFLFSQLNYPFTVTVQPEVTSTNTLLRQAAEAGAREGEVLIAEAQTDGRGRMGHSFWSPDGTGLYLSVLLRPTGPIAEVTCLLTPAAAVAAARAVEAVAGTTADIKWVNDIYCHRRKVCGILTEGRPDPHTGQLAFAVVGAGFNVAPPRDGFPDELCERAGTVLPAMSEDARERLAAAFLNEFWKIYTALHMGEFYDEYRERCLRLMQRVQVPFGKTLKAGTVIDVTPSFALRVRMDGGEVHDFRAGDVSIVFDK